MRILGIDPGTRVVGYGAVEDDDRPRLVDAGTVAAPANLPLPRRLVLLRDGVRAAIERLRPECVAVERAFFGRNVQALIALGEGRGVALLCAAELGLPIHEYSPAEVKKAVTGRGSARKGQVADLVKGLLGAPHLEVAEDATDALALALCHMQRRHLAVAAARSNVPIDWMRSSGGRARRGRRR